MLVVLLLVNGCTSYDDDPPQGTEIDRTHSPDGRLDAVVLGGGGDATTGEIHDVFLVPHGAPLPRRSERIAVFEWVYRNDSTTGLKLRWHGSDTLALEYLRAQHQRVFRPSVPEPNGPVTVILVNGAVDSSLTPHRE